MDIVECVRRSATKKILVLPHAAKQMLRPDSMITMEEVRHVTNFPMLTNGKMIFAKGETDEVSLLSRTYGAQYSPISC